MIALLASCVNAPCNDTTGEWAFILFMVGVFVVTPAVLVWGLLRFSQRLRPEGHGETESEPPA